MKVTATVGEVTVTITAPEDAKMDDVREAMRLALAKVERGEFADPRSGEEVIFELMRRGLFMATEDGDVFRRDRRSGEWRRMGFRNTAGYVVIRHREHDATAYCYAHRLAWLACRGPIPQGLVINHLDGCKSNNRIDNLEVVSVGDNVRHAVRVLGVNRGERAGNSKLTADDVREIRRLRDEGETFAALGRRFGVSGNQARLVATGRNWGHIGRE